MNGFSSKGYGFSFIPICSLMSLLMFLCMGFLD